MSVTVMTPEEFSRLPWYARQRAVNRHLRSLRVDPTPAVHRLQENADWAAAVQQQARDLLAALPPDPNASTHREALRCL